MSARPAQPEALPLQTRLAPLGTVDVAARTIECVWTTGATVRRMRWSGWDTRIPFDEELLVTDDAIDLTRLKAGAPVLDSHARYSIEDQRAVVEDAWLDAGKGYARMRFPTAGTDARADRLFELANQKIIRNISVGYSIDQVRVVEPENAKQVERRIIERWTPFELSFVSVPADAGAQVREGERTFPVAIFGAAPAAREAGLFAAVRARMSLRARAAGLAG